MRAGSRPPISSMTSDTAGSARTRSGSVVSGHAAGSRPSRGRGDVGVDDGDDAEAAARPRLEVRPVLGVDLEHAAADGPEPEEPDPDLAHGVPPPSPATVRIPRRACRIRCSFSTSAKRT